MFRIYYAAKTDLGIDLGYLDDEGQCVPLRDAATFDGKTAALLVEGCLTADEELITLLIEPVQ